MTIRRYSWFEKLNSPFLNPEVKFEVNTVIPSAFVMCSSKEDLRKYSSNDIEKLISDSLDWSEDLDINDIPDMIKAITKQLSDMNRVSPDLGNKETVKKKQE